MEPKNYTVVKIEGEYAYLREENGQEEDILFVALALLPPGVDIGSRLRFDFLEYTLLES